MMKRLDYRAIAPEGMKAFYGVSTYLMAIALMNAYNRIGVGFRSTPGALTR